MTKAAKVMAVSIAVSALIVSSQALASSAGSIKVAIGNQDVKTHPSPYVINGTVMVPLTLAGQLHDVHLEWDHPSKTVTVLTSGQSYRLKAGQPYAVKGDEKVPLQAAASIKGNHMMVSLRFIAEISAADVSWDPAKRAAVFHNVGPKGSEETAPVQLGESTYTIPVISEKFKKYSFAAKTASGIVWSPAPPQAESADASVYYPSRPYTIYLSDPNQHILKSDQAKKLITLNSPDKEMYMVLGGLYGIDDVVVYHTFMFGKGMAQAARSQAWVMKVSNPQTNKEMESFHAAGGYLYYFGIDQQDGSYVSLSYIPGKADGSYEKKLMVYNLRTGKKEFPDQFTEGDGVIQFPYHGKTCFVAMKQV